MSTNSENPLQQPAAIQQNPWERLNDGKAIFAFVCVLLSYSIYYVDRALVTNIMPRIAGQLDGMQLYSWVFTINMLIATCMAPIWGKLSDTYGRRNIFMIMLGSIMTGLILCSFSTSFPMLIVARGIVGFGAGGIQAVTFALIADLFAPADRGKYSGWTTVMVGLAGSLIPVTAGWVTDTFGWRAAFLMPVPLAVIALVLDYFIVPNVCSQTKPKIDYLGSLLLAMATVPLLLAFSWAGSLYKWGTPVNMSLIAFALIMFVVFYKHESRTPHALISPALLKNRPFVTAALVSVGMAFSLLGVMIYVPLFNQGVLGLSTTVHGAIMAPREICGIAAGLIAGWLMSKTKRYKWLLILGPTSSVIVLVLLSYVEPGVSILYLTVLLAAQMAFGGFMPAVNPIAALNGLKPEESGQAAGTLYYFSALGLALAPSLLGSVLNSGFSSALQAKLTPELVASLTTAQNAAIHNPRILLNPAAMKSLESSFSSLGPNGAEVFRQVVDIVRGSMHQGLQDLFLVAAAITFVSVICAISLKELPMAERAIKRGH
ncbi:MFS transporter [Sporomusa malonica]|uniref:Sugar phosphate permease n=1 Tax=Sporomusa malonica TaxID=112901 RepID=A0A1W1ZXH3_9FIRM|nr:MFS transporter [Sporomusa malonica]SMC52922.1 Sugar phosphate permease [Sporomusa malonica]